MLFIICFVKSSAIFSGKCLCWSLFLIKFIKKRLPHRCFPVNIANFLITVFFIEFLRLLLLDLQKQSFADALQNRCSEKFHNIVRKIPVLDLFLIKFIKRRLQHRYFPVNIAKFLRTV